MGIAIDVLRGLLLFIIVPVYHHSNLIKFKSLCQEKSLRPSASENTNTILNILHKEVFEDKP